MLNLSRHAPWALAALRIMVGLLFLEHGTAKLFNFPPGAMPAPAVFSLFWIQAVIELVGGLLFTIGFGTPFVAFILCGDAAVAYFMIHAPKGFFPLLNGGEGAILYRFVFLYFVFADAGPISVDGARRR